MKSVIIMLFLCMIIQNLLADELDKRYEPIAKMASFKNRMYEAPWGFNELWAELYSYYTQQIKQGKNPKAYYYRARLVIDNIGVAEVSYEQALDDINAYLKHNRHIKDNKAYYVRAEIYWKLSNSDVKLTLDDLDYSIKLDSNYALAHFMKAYISSFYMFMDNELEQRNKIVYESVLRIKELNYDGLNYFQIEMVNEWLEGLIL